MSSELEFLNNLWGLGTEKEYGYRTDSPGYIKAGGIHSLELIPGLHKRLKILAQEGARYGGAVDSPYLQSSPPPASKPAREPWTSTSAGARYDHTLVIYTVDSSVPLLHACTPLCTLGSLTVSFAVTEQPLKL